MVLSLLPSSMGHAEYKNGQMVMETLHPEWSLRQSALDRLSQAHGCGGVCVATPEVTELTEGHPGYPLELTLYLFDIASSLSSAQSHSICTPLSGAWADLWSADVEGVYSGFNASQGGPGGPGGPPPSPPPKGPGGPPHRGPGGPPGGPGGPGGQHEPDNHETFLRGIQQADKDGKVVFNTVYPGWYAGRTIHLHLKVHAPSFQAASGMNETHAHTTQLFFAQEANDFVATMSPYIENKAKRVTNEHDGIFGEMFPAGILKTEFMDLTRPEHGLRGELGIGVDKWW
ncbi:hypothetical protein P7C73_g4590, partial [Tremellales sp. Uapishka_1]